MPDTKTVSYLSIGEVLGLLLEEFPDITISKIRFLESQGLISPERTASGYRKFYDDDVQLLRVILTEQHANYLPLRVIKDRLDSGEIDPTGEHLRPSDGDADGDATPAEIPTDAIRAHPSSRANPASADGQASAGVATSVPVQHVAGAPTAPTAPPSPAPVAPVPGVLVDRAELCAMAGMTDAELTQLEEFGVLTARPGGGPALYDDIAVTIAKPACELLRTGLDARHLRGWRTSAEREASLFEQMMLPRFRQRNPEARAEALSQLRRLDALGASLRSAMTRQALRHHLEP